MATRKSKKLSPLTWLPKLRQRLTSRMACFVWGAVFGNALLSQPINPLNLLLGPPEQMLNDSSRQWLEQLRQGLRGITGMVETGAVDLVRDQALQQLRQRIGSPDNGSGAAAPSLPSSAMPARTGSDFAACATQFPGQRTLQLQTLSAQWLPQALCSEAFAVLYSGLTKTPLLVVEQLNRTRLQHAAGLERSDHFYPDPRVPQALRAELADYQGSGYDRGHLSPAANQPSTKAMAESFALSNMVPQDPTHNRKVWSKLEADVRKYAQRAAGNVYVFSGPLHEGTPRKVGPNHVWVPSHLFKLVYDEAGQRAWAYVLPNQPDAQITRPLDYASFVQRTHWHVLAGLPVVGSIRQ